VVGCIVKGVAAARHALTLDSAAELLTHQFLQTDRWKGKTLVVSLPLLTCTMIESA